MMERTRKADTGLFYCPIPAAVHLGVAEIAERSLAWVTRMGLCTDERQRRRAMAANGAEFYGRITPHGDLDRLGIAADWIYWAGFFDDTRCDEGVSRDRSDGFTALASRLLRTLESLDPRVCEGDPCLLALLDIAVRFSKTATPVQMNRWVEAHRKWLFGVADRRALAARGAMPGVDAYLTMRLWDAAGAPITAMIEMVNGGEIPAPEMDTPRVRAVAEIAAMIGALDNDRISRFKEVHGNTEEHNLLNVITGTRGCPPEEALREIVALRDRMMCLFLRLREEALSGAGPALRRYLADLGHMIRGHVDWSFTAARYSTLYGADGAPTGAVELEIGWASEPSDDRLEAPPLPSIAWWWGQLPAPSPSA
jgi:terpene synthase-like protein